MRAWMCVWFWCLALGIGLAASNPPAGQSGSVERFRIAGRDYIRLKDWARLIGAEVQQPPRSRDLSLSTRAARIGLTADSNRAQFNGTRLLLCYPIVEQGNALFISALDAQYSLRPLLYPPRTANRSVKTIVLDPGHGGRDPGNQEGSALEKKLSLLLALELKAQLVKAGYKVQLTRSSDEFIELEERPLIAKRRGADLFLSLHFNGAVSSVSGVETYCMTPAGASSSNAGGQGASSLSSPGNLNNPANMTLAYQIHRTLVRTLGTEDRGVKRARFAVLREASMPAVLIEGGFMSNPAEARKLNDPAYRKRMAAAIVEGIRNYERALGATRTS
jgi:N-acetylmuramoyl-L-alanine amidase